MRRSVLIVDDSASFRAAARGLLEDEGFTCVGEAADGDEALRALERTAADIVLLDIALPGADGIEIAATIALQVRPPAVVLISSRPATVYGRRLAEAQACGFLAKHELSGARLASLIA
jgi:DNA-binding NarL/FixJ family response regulator